jgi:anti-sigma factor RsiW
MTEDGQLTPEARAMVERLTFTAEEWAESKAEYEAEIKRRAKKLFGDQQPFAIPDADTDA